MIDKNSCHKSYVRSWHVNASNPEPQNCELDPQKNMKHLLMALAVTVSLTTLASATTIGVSMRTFDDNYLTNLKNAIDAEAKVKNVHADFESANLDVGKQISQVQAFIAQHADAIIVNTVDSSATPKITQLASQGIPLVYVSIKPADKTLPHKVVFVGSDDEAAGTLQGQEMARQMGGKGNMVILEGELDNSSAVLRTAAVENVVKKFPDIKIIEKQVANWSRTDAISLVSNWLTTGEKINAMAANNDEMAIGAILALKQAGQNPKNYVIGGIDATADAFAEIANGDLAVTVDQGANKIGASAIDIALKLINGEPVDSYVYIPSEIVTKDNYKKGK
jgi:ABC-type sugar transport system substrate-binding protein